MACMQIILNRLTNERFSIRSSACDQLTSGPGIFTFLAMRADATYNMENALVLSLDQCTGMNCGMPAKTFRFGRTYNKNVETPTSPNGTEQSCESVDTHRRDVLQPPDWFLICGRHGVPLFRHGHS
jgi:hypothetical protein